MTTRMPEGDQPNWMDLDLSGYDRVADTAEFTGRVWPSGLPVLVDPTMRGVPVGSSTRSQLSYDWWDYQQAQQQGEVAPAAEELDEGDMTLDPQTAYERLRAFYPGMPESFLKEWARLWSESGEPDLALAQVQSDSRFGSEWFPGIKRDDGTLRMDIATYQARSYAYDRELAGVGLNPELFRSQYVSLIEGEVSVNEFADRLQTVQTRVMDNIDGVRTMLAQYEGLPADLSDQAIFAWAVDPANVGAAILDRRITMAQIGAEAARQGYQVGSERAAMLASFGYGQEQARDTFQTARTLLPRLNQFAGRYTGDTDVDLDEYLEASTGNIDQVRRFQRLLSQDEAQYRFGSRFADDDRGITGLSAR